MPDQDVVAEPSFMADGTCANPGATVLGPNQGTGPTTAPVPAAVIVQPSTPDPGPDTIAQPSTPDAERLG